MKANTDCIGGGVWWDGDPDEAPQEHGPCGWEGLRDPSWTCPRCGGRLAVLNDETAAATNQSP